MQVPYSEDLASYTDPESCIYIGNGMCEALTGGHVGQVSSRENYTYFGVPTSSGRTEGKICCITKGKIHQDPAWSEALCTYDKLLAREPGDPVFDLGNGSEVRVGNPTGVIRQ